MGAGPFGLGLLRFASRRRRPGSEEDRYRVRENHVQPDDRWCRRTRPNVLPPV